MRDDPPDAYRRDGPLQHLLRARVAWADAARGRSRCVGSPLAIGVGNRPTPRRGSVVPGVRAVISGRDLAEAVRGQPEATTRSVARAAPLPRSAPPPAPTAAVGSCEPRRDQRLTHVAPRPRRAGRAPARSGRVRGAGAGRGAPERTRRRSSAVASRPSRASRAQRGSWVSGVSKPRSRTGRPRTRTVSPSTTSMSAGAMGPEAGAWARDGDAPSPSMRATPCCAPRARRPAMGRMRRVRMELSLHRVPLLEDGWIRGHGSRPLPHRACPARVPGLPERTWNTDGPDGAPSSPAGRIPTTGACSATATVAGRVHRAPAGSQAGH